MPATQPARTVADVVGETIGALGVEDVFGVLGSGNLLVTNALARSGAAFHHTRREDGAVCAADGYARASGRTGVCSVHQGPGLTNTLTGLAEAAKSRSSVLVLAGETPAAALTSNFRIDQHGLVESVGAIAERLHGRDTAADDAVRAFERASAERRPVVLMLPIDIQAQAPSQNAPARSRRPALPTAVPSAEAVARAAEVLIGAERPVIIAGRGAVLAGAGEVLEELGQLIGALMATSAPANGTFSSLPYAVGIAGGFATPFAQELLPGADVILAVGASLNHWTTKHGALIGPDARVIQIDAEPGAIGRHRRADLALVGDARATTEALVREITSRDHHAAGFRRRDLAARLAARRWEHEPYEDASTDAVIDPRTLSIALNRILPRERAVVVDSGHFTGYPSMYLDVFDPRAWLFVNGFQAVGLGIASGIGAAIARPDRTTVVAVGDGGAFMALPELETAARLGLRLLIVIYDDAAYGAEVHHFEPMGHDVSRVRFPDADLAAIASAAGARAASIRTVDDLAVVEEWLADPRGPLVLDAKVNPAIAAEWLAEAFRGG